MTKKLYNIPVSWEMCGWLKIEAGSLKEAIDIALSAEQGLPEDQSYVDDSFQVTPDMIEELYPDEAEHINFKK